MSDKVFIDEVLSYEEEEIQKFIEKVDNIEEIYLKIGMKCDNYGKWSENKKLFLVFELLEVRNELRIRFDKKIENQKNIISSDKFENVSKADKIK